MPTASHNFSVTVAGVTSQKAVVRSGDHPASWEIPLPVAKILTAWVKTDANTAAGNLASGHGLTTGVFDVYWDGGQRYGVTCTITTDAVALEGGAGTDFPETSDATVRISKQVTVNTPIDGDAIQLGFVKLGYVDPDESEARGRALFEDAAGDDIFDMDTADGLTANATNIYDVAGGVTNPFTGDVIATCKASHSNIAAAATLYIAMLLDSTP